MRIAELGLRPCLIEDFPITFKDELEAINKKELEIDRSNYLKSRKKRLKAKMAKSQADE